MKETTAMVGRKMPITIRSSGEDIPEELETEGGQSMFWDYTEETKRKWLEMNSERKQGL